MDRVRGVELGAVPTESTGHRFRSRDKNWIVTLRSSRISLESTTYPGFEDMQERLQQLLTQSKDILQTDFFTRVGLRFVNDIPTGSDPVEWIRPELIAALPVFGSVTKCMQEIRGPCENGTYSLRHGFDDQGDERVDSARKYVIDSDFFQEGVESRDVMPLVFGYHELAYSLFEWCIGEATRTLLRSTN